MSHAFVPKHKKTTYASFICNHIPLKDEKSRVRVIVGGDRSSYFVDSYFPATNIAAAKSLFKSIISGAKDGAQFAIMDLNDISLHTIMGNLIL